MAEEDYDSGDRVGYSVNPSFIADPTQSLTISLTNFDHCYSSIDLEADISSTSGPSIDFSQYFDSSDKEIVIPSCELIALSDYDFDINVHYLGFGVSDTTETFSITVGSEPFTAEV